MGNHALEVNSVVFRHANLEITRRGSDWLFTVCAIMGVSTLAVLAHSFTRPHHQRFFHQITAVLLFVASISYFTMGSNLGQVPIQAEFVRRGDSQVRAAGTREIFYVRYIDWFITTPLLLTDLLLTAGLPWSNVLAAVFADEIMIVCGLVGALIQTTYKWGFWTFGMIAFFYVVYTLLIVGRQSATILGDGPKRTYYSCGVLTIGVWFLYPIAWGCCEGGNVIHPDSEAVFYGILDVIAKPVFSFLLLWGHRNIDPAILGVSIAQPGYPVVHDPEKQHHGHHHGEHHGIHDGTHDGAAPQSGVASEAAPTATATT